MTNQHKQPERRFPGRKPVSEFAVGGNAAARREDERARKQRAASMALHEANRKFARVGGGR